jgi:hypothetical protein
MNDVVVFSFSTSKKSSGKILTSYFGMDISILVHQILIIEEVQSITRCPKKDCRGRIEETECKLCLSKINR